MEQWESLLKIYFNIRFTLHDGSFEQISFQPTRSSFLSGNEQTKNIIFFFITS